jgi:hypothetical protein
MTAIYRLLAMLSMRIPLHLRRRPRWLLLLLLLIPIRLRR